MKNYIILTISFVLFLFACEKEHKIEFYDLGTEFSVSGSGMTSLDNQAEISVDNPLKNLSSLTVEHKGVTDPDDEPITPAITDLGTITLSDGAGSITLTETQLGISETDWQASLMLDGVINGKAISRPYSITVESPFSTEDPGIAHRNDTSYYFQYAVEPASATVSDVAIETKTGSKGTYAVIAGSWKAIDSVKFTGSDYSVGDTIFVKITGTAGTKSDVEISQLIVSPFSFPDVDEFKLDSTTNQAYDLLLASVVDASLSGDSADIELISADISGGYDLGFQSNNNAEFIEVTKQEYADGDKLVASSTDFSGALKTVPKVVGGETYVYRTKRGAGAFNYGYLKVVTVDKPQGIKDDSSVEFEFKH